MAVETWSVISSLCKDRGALKNLQCPYCANLLRNPVQPACGHRLCQLCADKIIKTSTPPVCPQVDCEEEFTTEDGAHVSGRLVHNCVDNYLAFNGFTLLLPGI